MPWAVRFRGNTFMADELWDPEFEHEIREALTDRRELSGSANIVVLDDEEGVTISESYNPDEFPFKGVHGKHAELGEVFIFSGIPDDGDGEVFALYANNGWGEQPHNGTTFKGDGS